MPNVNLLEQVRTEFRSLFSSRLFECSRLEAHSEKIEAYAYLDILEKACAAAKKDLYADIEQVVDRTGDILENGHKEVRIGDITMTRQKRVSKEPDTDQVRIMLADKDIPLEKAFDEVKSWVYNPSKVSSLVQRGFLDEGKIEETRSVKFALVPSVSKKLKDDLIKHERGSVEK